MAPPVAAALLGGAWWKGSHFWPNQLSAAGVGEKAGIPEALPEADTGRDVTSALLKLGAF